MDEEGQRLSRAYDEAREREEVAYHVLEEAKRAKKAAQDALRDYNIRADSAARQTKLREIVAEFEKTMRCNCDLDNWEPEASTGHSHVCRIHKAAKAR